MADFPIRAPDHRTLGEHVGTRVAPRYGLRHDFLGVPQAVHGGGVDPVDARVQGRVDRHKGLGVVLRAPTKIPAPSADRPGTNTQQGDGQIAVAEGFLLHARSPSGLPARLNGGCRKACPEEDSRTNWLFSAATPPHCSGNLTAMKAP